MTRRRQLRDERGERLAAAQQATDLVSAQGERVKVQISLVTKLSTGWRRVHEYNHLAELFRGEGAP